jgi:hypothetical protein
VPITSLTSTDAVWNPHVKRILDRKVNQLLKTEKDLKKVFKKIEFITMAGVRITTVEKIYDEPSTVVPLQHKEEPVRYVAAAKTRCLIIPRDSRTPPIRVKQNNADPVTKDIKIYIGTILNRGNQRLRVVSITKDVVKFVDAMNADNENQRSISHVRLQKELTNRVIEIKIQHQKEATYAINGGREART